MNNVFYSPNFEYDIFISYRHKDNKGDHWVTEFVEALKTELESTFKEDISIYFDTNPHDGLLETHNVDKSLEGKLKCLIFIPIISQTYCDPKSFAWQHEFCAFNKLAKEDQFGRDVKLSNGNVASRILPVKIHDLDKEDKSTIENEIGGPLRAIEFIYKEPGVNRPLTSTDSKHDNQNKTDYRNQVNKVANAVKEIITSLTKEKVREAQREDAFQLDRPNPTNKKVLVTLIVLTLVSFFVGYFFYTSRTNMDPYSSALDRADKYLEEAARFDDDRYIYNAREAVRSVLTKVPSHERALYLMFIISSELDTTEIFLKKLDSINPGGLYASLGKAGHLLEKNQTTAALKYLERALEIEPNNKDGLRMLAAIYLMQRDYLNAWKVVQQLKEATGETDHEFLSIIYLELGDFYKAEQHLLLKRKEKEFSCPDLEALQRIYLCVGKFEKLELLTDSICRVTKCEQCSYWRLRAKAHTEKYKEAAPFVKDALDKTPKIAWRLPAFVLLKNGKTDSARLILEAELNFDKERIADTAYHQTIPFYSMAAIHAMQGNKSESLKWLREYSTRGFELGSEWYIAHDPLFNEVQKDPEYFADFIEIRQKAQASKNALREKLRQMEESE